MTWIRFKENKPDYYKSVIILCKDDSIYTEWYRVSNGDDEYFISLKTDKIIDSKQVTFWKPMPPHVYD